jgi:hypothetical protein
MREKIQAKGQIMKRTTNAKRGIPNIGYLLNDDLSQGFSLPKLFSLFHIINKITYTAYY